MDTLGYWRNAIGPRGNGHPAGTATLGDLLELPSDEWFEWADRVIADDGSQPERAKRARERIERRRRGRGW